MDSANSRTLLECKLRRCVYLGTRYSIYIPPVYRDKFWGKNYFNHRFDFHIVKTIGNAVNKNNVVVINSIVPTLQKINREKPLNGDKHLIYALAVCAKFNLNQCKQMVRDAYDTVDIFCTDGTKLLMFAKYCIEAARMLYDLGYLLNEGKGLSGYGFKKAMRRWYSKRNTLETIQLILQSNTFENMTHKKVMENCKYFSDDPVHKIIIIYVTQSMNGVKEYYQMMKRGSQCNDNYDKELTFSLINSVYTYLHEYHNSLKIKSKDDIQRLIYFIRLHLLGRQHDVLPLKLQYDLNFLPSYVEHMPLRSLLSKTCCLAKNKLFLNLKGDEGCLMFINRFNHRFALQKSQIHPIESYVTFLKYAKTGGVLFEIKKPKDSVWKDVYNYTEERVTDCSKSKNNNAKLTQHNNDNTQEMKWPKHDSIFFMKPKPKYSEMLMKFLSKDLVIKTLDNLEQTSDCHILIAYDSRQYLKTRKCRYPHVRVVNMIDAITITILSIIYPLRVRPSVKPTIVALNDSPWRFNKIYVDFKPQHLTLNNLKETLFKTASNEDSLQDSDKDLKPVYPLSTMNWARKKNKCYDLFFFLGTHKTDFKHLKRIKAEYSSFLGKRVKTVFCCLSGKYKNQLDLSREGMLFIPGFDKYIGQIIQSYINDQF